jgi:hypothetical protein
MPPQRHTPPRPRPLHPPARRATCVPSAPPASSGDDLHWATPFGVETSGTGVWLVGANVNGGETTGGAGGGVKTDVGIGVCLGASGVNVTVGGSSVAKDGGGGATSVTVSGAGAGAVMVVVIGGMNTMSGGTDVGTGVDVGAVVLGGATGSAVQGGDGVVTTAAANPRAAAGTARMRTSRRRRRASWGCTAPPG